MDRDARKLIITPGNYQKHDITGESVTVAAGNAGAVIDCYLTYKPISDANGSFIGGYGDSSFSIAAGTVFTTEVAAKTPNSDLANGEFWIDYIRGRIHGKKYDNSTTLTVDYSILK